MTGGLLQQASQKEIGSRRDDIYLLALFFICFLLYFPLFHHYFLSDDGVWLQRAAAFEKNRAFLFSINEDGYPRPFLILFFSFLHRIFLLNASGYYGALIFLHAVNALLLYALVSQFAEPCTSRCRELGFLSALVFMTSQSHYQPVFWIAALTHSFSTCFFLSSFFLFSLYARRRKKTHLVFSLACYAVGFFSRESVLFLPFIFLFLYRREWKPSLLFFAAAAAYVFLCKFYLRTPLASVPPAPSFSGQGFEIVGSGFKELFLEQAGFSTSLIPQQNFFSVLGGFSLACFAGMIFLSLLFFSSLRQSAARFKPLYFISLLWLFFTLLPLIFFPVIRPEGMFHRFRYFYLPGTAFSFFFVLVLVTLASAMRAGMKRRIFPVFCFLFVLVFSLFSNVLALRSLMSVFHGYSVLSRDVAQSVIESCPPKERACCVGLLEFPEKPFLVFWNAHIERLSSLLSDGRVKAQRVLDRKSMRRVLAENTPGCRKIFLSFTGEGIKDITSSVSSAARKFQDSSEIH